MSRPTSTRGALGEAGEADTERVRDLGVELVGHRATDVVRLDDGVEHLGIGRWTCGIRTLSVRGSGDRDVLTRPGIVASGEAGPGRRCRRDGGRARASSASAASTSSPAATDVGRLRADQRPVVGRLARRSPRRRRRAAPTGPGERHRRRPGRTGCRRDGATSPRMRKNTSRPMPSERQHVDDVVERRAPVRQLARGCWSARPPSCSVRCGTGPRRR